MSTLINKAQSLSQKELLKLINQYDQIYYNDSEIKSPSSKRVLKPISDKQYDQIRDIYETRFGTLEKVGVRGDRKEVELEYYMGSLDKKKTEKDITNWLKKVKGPILIDDKVDGVSCLYINDGKKVYLRKRGDGWTGSDITYLVDYLILPKIKEKCAVRLELVIKKKVFESKYKTKYTNARAMVAGVTNSKHFISEEVRDISCIAYQYFTSGKQLPKSDQLTKLKQLGFTIACDEIKKLPKLKITVEGLQNWLSEREQEASYIIDGLVLTDDNPYELNTDENPDYSIAFKGVTESAITKVTGVEWNPSKDGYLKPTVLFQPVNVSEAKLSRATGFNAQFIKDKGIGVGAKIEIVRSGGVIAYIKDVIKGVEPLFPDEDYEWSGVDIILVGEDERVDLKNIVFFFKTLGVKYLSEKTLEKLFNNGFDTIDKIIDAKPDDFIDIERMGKSSSEKICKNIKTAINGVELALVMAASGCFGRGLGYKKLEKLVESSPDIMSWTAKDCGKIRNVLVANGIDKLADNFITGLPVFKKFLKDNPKIKYSLPNTDEDEQSESEESEEEEVKPRRNSKSKSKKSKSENSDSDESFKVKKNKVKFDFKDKTVIFSGFRDKELEASIKKLGGKVVSGMSKKVEILVVKEKGKYSAKELDAIDRGLTILTRDDIYN